MTLIGKTWHRYTRQMRGAYETIKHEKWRAARNDATFESEDNAYSCCRLLWSQDRNGRKTLRSAATGFDHLYYADEEVWLGDVSTNGEFRIVRHYFDAFGRETNRVVSVGSTPGEAVPASGQGIPSLNPAQIITSEESLYPYGGSDYFVRKDIRGTVTINYRSSSCEGMGSTEIITTNGVEISRNEYFSYFDGGYESTRERASSSSYKSERQRRSDYYLSSGNKVTYDVTYAYTASSGRYDSYVVTNSVSEYDMLGRLIATTVPGANGSLIVTSNTYDRASSRVIESVTSGEMPKSYHYNEYGAQVGRPQTDINSSLATGKISPGDFGFTISLGYSF